MYVCMRRSPRSQTIRSSLAYGARSDITTLGTRLRLVVQTLLRTHNETREDRLRRGRERERKRKRGRASETGILLHKHRREDRLRRRRECERKRRAPERGGTLEKAMELVQSHSQRILSYSRRLQHTLYCWGALIGVTTWTVHSYMYIW